MPAPLPARLAALCALALAAGPALAADFDGAYPPPDPHPFEQGYGRGHAVEPEGPPPPPALHRPRFAASPPEACREFVRRRLDPYGEPVLRRVRVCDEPDLGRDPPPPPPDDIPPRRWGGPRW